MEDYRPPPCNTRGAAKGGGDTHRDYLLARARGTVAIAGTQVAPAALARPVDKHQGRERHTARAPSPGRGPTRGAGPRGGRTGGASGVGAHSTAPAPTADPPRALGPALWAARVAHRARAQQQGAVPAGRQRVPGGAVVAPPTPARARQARGGHAWRAARAAAAQAGRAARVPGGGAVAPTPRLAHEDPVKGAEHHGHARGVVAAAGTHALRVARGAPRAVVHGHDAAAAAAAHATAHAPAVRRAPPARGQGASQGACSSPGCERLLLSPRAGEILGGGVWVGGGKPTAIPTVEGGGRKVRLRGQGPGRAAHQRRYHHDGDSHAVARVQHLGDVWGWARRGGGGGIAHDAPSRCEGVKGAS